MVSEMEGEFNHEMAPVLFLPGPLKLGVLQQEAGYFPNSRELQKDLVSSWFPLKADPPNHGPIPKRGYGEGGAIPYQPLTTLPRACPWLILGLSRDGHPPKPPLGVHDPKKAPQKESLSFFQLLKNMFLFFPCWL